MSQAGILNLETGPSPPDVAIDYVTDSGTAVASLNILNVFGSGGTTVSGSGNTITIHSAATITGDFVTDVSGPVFPTALGVINVTGATNIFSDGSIANTLTLNLQGTAHALFVGRGSDIASANLAVGATNTVLLGNTGLDPSFGQVPNGALVNSTVTLSNGNNITVTGGSPLALGGTATIAVTGTTTNAVQIGNISGSLTSLTVGTNGQVLIGATGAAPAFATITSTGGTITFTPGANTLNMEAGASVATTYTANDSSTATPALNILKIYGTTVAAGTTPVATTAATNIMTLNVQKSQAIAAADTTKIGLSNFDSGSFAVDATGFVTLSTTGAGKTITGNSGGALSPTANNWNIYGASTAAGTSPVTTSGAASTLTVNVQKSQAIAATDATKIGLCNFNSAQFTVDANGFVSSIGGASGVTSVGTQTGTNPITPTGGGLITINGATVAAGTNPVRTDGTGANTMAVEVQIAQAIGATDATKIGLAAFNTAQFTVDANGFVSCTSSTNDLHVAKLIVNPTPGNGGNYTTITAALTAASSGDTIFVMPGTYTENPPLKNGVNICAFDCDATTPNVIIYGSCTASFTGKCSLSGLCLQSQSGGGLNALYITGANATKIDIENCFINSLGDKGVYFFNTNSSSEINFRNCITDTPASYNFGSFTGIGTINFYNHVALNSNVGNFVVATFQSSSITQYFNVNFYSCVLNTGFSYTDVIMSFYNCVGNSQTTSFLQDLASVINPVLNIVGCNLTGKTTSGFINIATNGTLNIFDTVINHDTNSVISGGGIFNYSNLTFTNASNFFPWPGTLNQMKNGSPLNVNNGGTGVATQPAYSLVCGGTTTTGNFQSIVSVASGSFLQSNGVGALPVWTSAKYPTSVGGVGTILRSDGTNWVATTSTYPNINAINTIVYASSANVLGALATANEGVLVTGPTTGIPKILAGPGTTGNILQSNAGAYPSFSTATYPASTTVNQILYSSSNNVVGGLATALNGVLVTGPTTGIPKILAGPGTTGNILQSNAAAYPSFSTATYPASTTMNQILYSSAANVVGGLTTANNGVLTTGTTGIPVITALAANGQLIIGSGAGAPAAATLTPGSGITITNAANSITIALTSPTVINTITGNSGGAESPSAGNFNILGTGSITVAGTANTETIQLTGLTNHAIQIGAGSATLTQLGAGTTGQVLQTNTTADPTWSTATYPSVATSTGTILRANGTNWVATTATYPTTTTINRILYSSAASVIGEITTANSGVLSTSATGVPSIDTTNFAVLTTGLQLKGNGANTAPPAGFIGEQIRSAITVGSAVASLTTAVTNITSIALTAGIWDISGGVMFTGMTTTTFQQASINTTSSTIGTVGDNAINAVFTSTTPGDFGICIPTWRLLTTGASTTVYLIGSSTYTVGTGKLYGRISAIRAA